MMQHNPYWSGVSIPQITAEITIELEEEKMWRDFGEHTTEMIVTKPGRKVFPKLNLKVGGLNPIANYGIMIIIQRADNFKYRFQAGRWRSCGEEDEETGRAGKIVYHRGKRFNLMYDVLYNIKNGFVQTGKDWMRKPIDFSHFKITNNKELDERHRVYAESLHKYYPIVEITDEFHHVLLHKPFEFASFVTVTAYQNPAIKQLKKSYNPYAAGQLKKSEKKNSTAVSRKRPPSSPLAALAALQTPPPQATPTQQQTTLDAYFPMMTPPSMVPYLQSYPQTHTPSPLTQTTHPFPTPPTPPNWQTPQRMASYAPPGFSVTPNNTPPGFPGTQFQYPNSMPFPNPFMTDNETPVGLPQAQNWPMFDPNQTAFDENNLPFANTFATEKEDDPQERDHQVYGQNQ
ncbi:hypothetical protein PRIPAC_93924 [Pristionchus pacificus]|uniref:Uncharacterized protein n=1 Tax=Pristionchus pacificus TaxID=54126 RepID=A0A2A6BA01_PRIPA|nr:hypothetical protein PRIPAC_93924 [Pristionchus pacificus]|eukprot:PDM62693.1 hypothetical protein PRIPAC_49908 [Pristionchus pacificus]